MYTCLCTHVILLYFYPTRYSCLVLHDYCIRSYFIRCSVHAVYICIHICNLYILHHTHTHIHTHTHTHCVSLSLTHFHTHTHHIHTHTQQTISLVLVCGDIHTQIHSYIHTHTPTHTHKSIHTYIHTQPHTHKHIHKVTTNHQPPPCQW